jgi:UDP-N-acetylmuramate--alanine ligase
MIDPTALERVHFVGIGGIGMSALARYLHARGVTVSGSDRTENDQTEELRALGIRVAIGHAPENLNHPKLVVYSSAVPVDNPELVAARARSILVAKRSVLLAAIVNRLTSIAVAGTHGKSTTSALIAHLLLTAGNDITVLIGGISGNLRSNARTGNGDIVVTEADEYDASFLQLRPAIGVITNVEAEHLDFYETLDRVHDAFRAFARSASRVLVVCADDPALPLLTGDTSARLVTYGISAGEWRASDIRDHGGHTEFTVRHGDMAHQFNMSLAGRHNVLNALAGIAVADCLSVDMHQSERGLASFAGVKRRFEMKGEAGGVLVMDDYAHHPTEIRVNLAAMRERFGRPIRVIFQPHTFSRTHTLLRDFAGSFADASAVYLTDIYAAREDNLWGITGRDLADAVSRHRPQVVFSGSPAATLDRVIGDVRPGDLVVTMGAGDISQLGSAILAALKAQPREAHGASDG